jgi:NitT/TauT family transport system permease protein
MTVEQASTTEPRRAPTATIAPSRRGIVWAGRVAVAVVFLAAWQWLPSVGFLHARFSFLDPFFISSPSRASATIVDLLTGSHDTRTIWSALGDTLLATLLGTVSAVVVGFLLGVLLSNWDLLNRIARPYLVLANSVPRISIIPIIVLCVGNPRQAGIVTAFTVIVVLVFFNAFEGATQIAPATLGNARLLGATQWTILFLVRGPYALAWTLASLPTAISFGIIGTVTAEIFTGGLGVGGLLTAAVSTANADLTMAVVIILSVVGVVAVVGTEALRTRLLPWWRRG